MGHIGEWSIILAIGRVRQENHLEFEANQACMTKLCLKQQTNNLSKQAQVRAVGQYLMLGHSKTAPHVVLQSAFLCESPPRALSSSLLTPQIPADRGAQLTLVQRILISSCRPEVGKPVVLDTPGWGEALRCPWPAPPPIGETFKQERAAGGS